MKHTYLLIIALLVSSMSFAQEEDVKDPKAKGILEKVSATFKAHPSLSGSFTYSILNKEAGIDETQSGSLKMKGNKYTVKMAGQQITSNGKTIWTFIEDAEEVQISNVPDATEEENNLLNPANIFSIHEKGFKYKYMTEKAGVHHINLFPIDAGDRPFHTIKLAINAGSHQITSATLLYKDGNTYTIKLEKFDTKVSLTDKDFEFDLSKFDEDSIIDLRD